MKNETKSPCASCHDTMIWSKVMAQRRNQILSSSANMKIRTSASEPSSLSSLSSIAREISIPNTSSEGTTQEENNYPHVTSDINITASSSICNNNGLVTSKTNTDHVIYLSDDVSCSSDMASVLSKDGTRDCSNSDENKSVSGDLDRGGDDGSDHENILPKLDYQSPNNKNSNQQSQNSRRPCFPTENDNHDYCDCSDSIIVLSESSCLFVNNEDPLSSPANHNHDYLHDEKEYEGQKQRNLDCDSSIIDLCSIGIQDMSLGEETIHSYQDEETCTIKSESNASLKEAKSMTSSRASSQSSSSLSEYIHRFNEKDGSSETGAFPNDEATKILMNSHKGKNDPSFVDLTQNCVQN